MQLACPLVRYMLACWLVDCLIRFWRCCLWPSAHLGHVWASRLTFVVWILFPFYLIRLAEVEMLFDFVFQLASLERICFKSSSRQWLGLYVWSSHSCRFAFMSVIAFRVPWPVIVKHPEDVKNFTVRFLFNFAQKLKLVSPLFHDVKIRESPYPFGVECDTGFTFTFVSRSKR
jgi:hypothetical protein